MKKRTLFLFSFFWLSVAFLSLLLLSLYVHNFEPVINHAVYRSRELSKAQFEHTAKIYHLNAILNLRGENDNEAWYQAELQASQSMHLTHYDISLQSKVLPSRKTLLQLITFLDTAPRPLLIHCESGVDRSGLAAVIVLLLDNQPLHTAKKQVSLSHFVLSDKSVGRQFVKLYGDYLERTHQRSSRAVFLDWAKNHYKTEG